MAITLVPKYVRALADHLNAYYRLLTGSDPASVDLRLNGGGRFAVHHSGTNAVVFQVTDAGATGSYAPGDITDPDIADQTIVNRHVNTNADITLSKLHHVGANNVLKSNGTQNVGGPLVAADIPNDSITSAKIVDDSIMNADINASAGIAITKLAHVGAGNVLRSSGTANQGGKVVSGDIADDTIVNADINSGAAIAYSKLALVGSIVNADVAAAAAIGLAKLAHVGAGNVLKSNGAANVGAQIVNADVQAGANIDGTKLADNSVPLGKLAGAATLGVAKLGEYIADGSSPIMFISGIPSTYRRLTIQWFGRSLAAGVDNASVGVNFESSPTVGAYFHQRLYGLGATPGAQENVGTSAFIHAGVAPAALSGASIPGSGTIELPEYTAPSLYRTVEVRAAGIMNNAAGKLISDTAAGLFVSAGPISLVRVVLVLGSNWMAGSRITIYGWPS